MDWIIILPFLALFFSVLLLFILPRYVSAHLDKDEYRFFFGMFMMVYWKPFEGVIITQNKRPIFISSGKDGGERLIFPVLGHRLEARIPLGDEKFRWVDHNKTLTREGIRVKTDVMVEWTISDLSRYLYSINRPPKPEGKSYYEYLKESTLDWISLSIESVMRKNIRLLSIGDLISSSSSFLNHEAGSSKVVNIDSVVQKLLRDLQKDLERYGIQICSLEILDVQFDKRVQKAIDSVKEAFLAYKRSEFEGRTAVEKLRPMIQELGQEAVIVMESLKASGGTIFFDSPKFFEGILSPKPGDEKIENGNKDHPLLSRG